MLVDEKTKISDEEKANKKKLSDMIPIRRISDPRVFQHLHGNNIYVFLLLNIFLILLLPYNADVATKVLGKK